MIACSWMWKCLGDLGGALISVVTKKDVSLEKAWTPDTVLPFGTMSFWASYALLNASFLLGLPMLTPRYASPRSGRQNCANEAWFVWASKSGTFRFLRELNQARGNGGVNMTPGSKSRKQRYVGSTGMYLLCDASETDMVPSCESGNGLQTIQHTVICCSVILGWCQ